MKERRRSERTALLVNCVTAESREATGLIVFLTHKPLCLCVCVYERERMFVQTVRYMTAVHFTLFTVLHWEHSEESKAIAG